MHRPSDIAYQVGEILRQKKEKAERRALCWIALANGILFLGFLLFLAFRMRLE